MPDAALAAIQECIQQDVGLRGLATDPKDNLLTACAADFSAACESLARASAPVLGVVTGFFIPHGRPPAAETDGPLGALFLARALVPPGISVVLFTDAFARNALEVGLATLGLRKQVPLVVLPSHEQAGSLSVNDYGRYCLERSGPLTHLLALERVGPSHYADSVRADERDPFLAEVPERHHDRCHNMAGHDITASMSPAHRLFEAVQAPAEPPVITLGLGDGGNEIGMGKIPWSVIRRNIPGGACIACRVPVDHLIVAGISNWGAYGLAAGVRLLRKTPPDPDLFDTERERVLLQALVERGPLVDGRTGEPTVTVDGLPFERYAEVLTQLGRKCAEVTG
jgi:hypothetical protein